MCWPVSKCCRSGSAEGVCCWWWEQGATSALPQNWVMFRGQVRCVWKCLKMQMLSYCRNNKKLTWWCGSDTLFLPKKKAFFSPASCYPSKKMSFQWLYYYFFWDSGFTLLSFPPRFCQVWMKRDTTAEASDVSITREKRKEWGKLGDVQRIAGAVLSTLAQGSEGQGPHL